ncbi:multi-sensor signal transduction multi-kinase [[Leptolyngbya] sp. PCC 7376]|uniref:trifunctional serine/threonine-protein kinase/ATP-binding protein/sensor histidine kinase n=1 Tax=[Leptolyngbya] sp. PCC 7376 TaxID=111781 RepID=UPI00029F1F5E|nr:ATP-binding sensor histidine kinase [[Leptolyngbya] sp. PCC 7376]AFY36896.1 multi-sensor signal transduction multi-kinase [[Leptolyngbya] sp. PCC 7376]
MTAIDNRSNVKPEIAGFNIVEQLYLGSRTAVYRARQSGSNNPVILKVLQRDYPSFKELVQFRNQYTITANLPISGIIKPLSLEAIDNSYVLVMEDWGGISLDTFLQEQTLDLTDVLAIASQLADILHDLHQHRVIHKDIKPANILIHPESKTIKLIDFSIASLLPKETQALQSPKSLEGTLAYLAPEQTGRMNRAIDYRTDFYALGVTLYQLLTGQLPFHSDEPLELIHCHMAQQPTPIAEANPNIPTMVAALVAKLMQKNAEDRYQSALGLKYDLEQCLTQWKKQEEIAEFCLGLRDVSDRFLIPEKLYGREAETKTLLNAFERVAQGQTEMMLVAGFSGIGKTAVINEVHKPITRQNGYFIKGKFDQFNRSTPFSAFVQAFRSLMGQLLGESDTDLTRWRTKILEAVGENGQVIIDVIPELATIIGEQPPLPELSGIAAQNRFNRLFSQFVRVFTTKEHPLVIFLDDLQWADSASLGLVKLLMGDSDAGYLLVLGAYRDNEVSPAHPLMLTLEEMLQKGANIGTITLAPLDLDDITSLIADTLLCSQESALALAKLVFQKAQGNPFFTTQFLQGLHEDGFIAYSAEGGCWQCDIAQVRALALTNDVVAFMVSRLKRLSSATQTVLKLAACIGSRFDLVTLAVVCEQSQEEVATALWAALKEGLVIPESETYKFFQNHDDCIPTVDKLAVGYQFLHDRVQQAAYALIPEAEKVATQYHIGQLLLACMNEANDDALLFNVVGYLNFGRDFLVDDDEQRQLIQLNLAAAQKALNSTAYDATIDYCKTGIELLGDEGWQHHYDLTLSLYQALGSAQLSSANYVELEQTTDKAFAEITSATDRAEICVLQLVGCCLQGRYAEAIDWGLTGLRDLDIDIQEDNIPALVEQEFIRLAEMMGDRHIYDLLEHNDQVPPLKIQAAIKLLVAIDPPVYITGRNSLYALVGLLGTRYSIEYGNIAESSKSYANYGMLLGSIQGDYQRGYTFAEMGVELAHRFNSKAMQCQAGLMLGSFAHPWARPIAGSSKVNNDSFLAGMEAGETQYAAYNLFGSVLNLLFQGEDLGSLANTILPSYDAVEKQVDSEMLRIALAGAQIFVQQLVAANTTSPEQTEIITEAQAVIRAGEISRNQLGLAIHYSLEMHRCCIIEDFEKGWQFFQQLQPIVSSLVGFPTHSYYFYYGSLVLLNTEFDEASDLEHKRWEWIEANQKQLKIWVDSCPENFLHKYLLVKAECCRVKGDRLGAMDLYHRAIDEAHTNGFMQEEALIHEFAARLYHQQGKDSFAMPHIQEAFYGYARWGAGAKTIQIETQSPRISRPAQSTGSDSVSTSMINRYVGVQTRAQSNTSYSINATLDQQAIFKASQAIASNIDLNALLTEVTRIILQNSGGDRCALILPSEANEWQVRAIATPEELQLCTTPLDNNPDLPVKLIQYVKNTQEIIVIDDLETDLPVIDNYLIQRQPKSVLCMPLLNQGSLIGILYLKNRLTRGVFTEERIQTINILCTQAAISLENARLYGKVQQTLTDLQQAQLKLVQSEKMSALGGLVAGVAHEINNPVGCILGNVGATQEYISDLLGLLDLYAEELPHPSDGLKEELEAVDLEYVREDLPKLIRAMEDSGDRITSISKSLRVFSRADTDQKQRFDIHEGMESTILILRHRLKANPERPEIKVISDYGDIPPIDCFPGQLNQVFMNILANAIDALDEANLHSHFADIEKCSPQITIRTEVDNNQVKITISDNGRGISETVQDKIFEHLFTTKKAGQGTGLGLAIAHQIIVKKHGGSLTVQSELGQSTTFCIQLPISSIS